MKKILSKILIVALALSMVFSLMAVLSGCSKKEDEKPKDPENEQNNDNENNKDVLSYLPDKKFNADYIFVCMDDGEEMYREDSEGDRLDYAIYMRNTKIEERYGIKFDYKSLPYAEIPDWVSDILKSGDDKSLDAVIAFNSCYQSNIIKKGNAKNLQEIPYIDLTKPWWAKSNLEDLTLNGKTYMAFGDMNTSSIGFTHCMFYNKELCNEYNIPNMYDLVVKDKNWTFDVMMGYIKNIRKDLNSDGRYDEKDRYGLVTNGWSSANNYIWAFDNPIFRKNAQTGELDFAFYNKKAAKIVDTLVNKLYYRVDGVYYESAQLVPAPMFVNEQAVFLNAYFGIAMTDLRDMPAENWGICPFPKYNDKQQNYLTSVDGITSSLIVPKTTNAEKLEKIGVISEALNALSHDGVVVEYYDKGLKSKYVGDPKEAEMIDMIMDNRVFDFGYFMIGFESPAFWIQEMVQTKNTNIASKYASEKSEVETAISEAYEAFGLTFPGLN